MPSTTTTTLLILTLVLGAITATAAYLYLYTDTGKDLAEWAAERFFKAKAKAEEKALEKAGEGKAEGFLKDQLKKNPVISNDELNAIQGGLGDEAAREFGGKKGFGAMLGK